MKTRRQLRMEERIKRVLGELLREGTKDPRVGFVSVMDVEITADLKQASVYISVMGEEADAAESLEGIESARGWLQGELGSRLGSRYTPVLRFFLDRSIKHRERITRIIEDLKSKGDWDFEEGRD